MIELYEATVVADSISPEGNRITSVYAVYPHAVHKDFLRHGLLRARSVESFRARPTELLIEDLEQNGAFCPDVFARRTAGMSQGESLEDDAAFQANRLWEQHVGHSVDIARQMGELDIAKQQRNFVLQDLCPLKEIITATDWSNFFALRLELDGDGRPVARPEIYKTALAIKEALDASTPAKLDHDQWHLPLVTPGELANLCELRCEYRANGDADKICDLDHYWALVSAGRCARFSYDKAFVREGYEASYERGSRLVDAGHTVPLEHAARPFSPEEWEFVEGMQHSSRLQRAILGRVIDDAWLVDVERQLEYSSAMHGWRPYRKMVADEHDYSLLQA